MKAPFALSQSKIQRTAVRSYRAKSAGLRVELAAAQRLGH
jgi:hypothetical protein